jgi:apolipoprotein N-acyltransferase
MPDLPLSLGFQSPSGIRPAQRFASWLGELEGWRRYLFAFLLGALAAAALPPVDVVPLLFLSFAGLVWLAEGCRRPREAFLLGWSFGFGFFVAGLYWIAVSMFTDIATFWWAVPFAVGGLPALFAIYTGLALLAYHWIAPRGASRALVLAALWTAAEWLRGHLFTGLPWNLIGYAWSGGFPGATAMLQTTATTGIYGLGLLTVIIATLPASLGDPPIGTTRGRRIVPAGAAVLLLAVLGAGGAVRLAGAHGGDVPNVVLRLVQPAIPQSLKWNPTVSESNFQRLLALSASPGIDRVTDIIWPEAASTYFLGRDAQHREEIAALAPKGGLVITGTLRTDPAPEQPYQHVWNSLAAINGNGDIVAVYDKVHLVPFGEYMPLKSILPLKKLTAGSIDLSAGDDIRTIDLPGLPPAGPLICYEVIFPGAVVEPGHRPAWLLNVTNDAWFGFSSGPFQHFAIARTRAVEEGLPLVRAANNGISGVIDPYGRVVRRLGLDDVGILDSTLPTALPPTIYSRVGDGVFLTLLLICLFPALRNTLIWGRNCAK